jgi:hypothetical protein
MRKADGVWMRELMLASARPAVGRRVSFSDSLAIGSSKSSATIQSLAYSSVYQFAREFGRIECAPLTASLQQPLDTSTIAKRSWLTISVRFGHLLAPPLRYLPTRVHDGTKFAAQKCLGEASSVKPSSIGSP